MIYFARRYAYNQRGAWHVGDGPAPEKVPTGTTMVCGYVTTSGLHQIRPVYSAAEAGVMTLCGRCIEALGMRRPVS